MLQLKYWKRTFRVLTNQNRGHSHVMLEYSVYLLLPIIIHYGCGNNERFTVTFAKICHVRHIFLYIYLCGSDFVLKTPHGFLANKLQFRENSDL